MELYVIYILYINVSSLEKPKRQEKQEKKTQNSKARNKTHKTNKNHKTWIIKENISSNLHFFGRVGEELVQRRVEQADRHRQAVHLSRKQNEKGFGIEYYFTGEGRRWSVIINNSIHCFYARGGISSSVYSLGRR